MAKPNTMGEIMKMLIKLCLVLSVMVALCGTAFAENATREECITMAKQAAEMIQQGQDAALAEIAKSDGKFVWKDSYVFVMNLKGKMLAHPFMPGLTRMDSLLAVPDKNLEKPKMIFVDFVTLAASKGEGWVEYLWPRPNETAASPKVTYIYRVPGTDLLTGAGYYK